MTSDFHIVQGFEEVWRAPGARRRRPAEVLGAPGELRARLTRLVRRAPEVMVKVTGRTRDAAHLRAHLDYISRHGGLALCDPDGWSLQGKFTVRELAEDWAAMAATDGRRTARTPMSLSLVLSMPAQTDPFALRDAAAAFARRVFEDRFDYVLALHTDTGHPHVHLAVRVLGRDGARLNPRKADLARWREVFAEALRARGVEAEATPRRARGVTRKAQRPALRRLADRAAQGAAPAWTVRQAWREAATAAFGDDGTARPWEQRLTVRQQQVRTLYLAQARLLAASRNPDDRRLGEEVAKFVQQMPAPDSRRLALARALRAAGLDRDPGSSAAEPERRR